MQAGSDELILEAWETCRARKGPLAALALAEVFAPGTSRDELAKLSLARRDRLLLEARRSLFGSRLQGFAVCDHCQAELEFEIDTIDFLEGLEVSPDPAEDQVERPVDTFDLIAIQHACDEDEAGRILLERTLGQTDSVDIETVRLRKLRFEALNAPAEIRLDLACAGCGQPSVADLDVPRFLLREIGWAAKDLLRQVDVLARAYGWSEREILGMGSARRNSYLEMVGA